jgi:predicted amidohydrolase
MGADVITYPSAFTSATGEAHWESLLRARAIETQCYVVAAAQTGTHGTGGRSSHGHSLVVDPWGKILADAGTEPGVVYADIHQSYAHLVRKKIPVIEHRRLGKIEVKEVLTTGKCCKVNQ